MDIIKPIIARRLGLSANGSLVLNHASGVQNLLGEVATVTIPAAQVLTLFTTARTLIAAPPAGLAIVPTRVAIYKAGGTAYAGIAAGEDLVVRYGGGSQAFMTIETTGFLDQASAQSRMAAMSGGADFTPSAAAALVIALLSGDITTGNSDLQVRVWYDLIATQFTA